MARAVNSREEKNEGDRKFLAVLVRKIGETIPEMSNRMISESRHRIGATGSNRFGKKIKHEFYTARYGGCHVVVVAGNAKASVSGILGLRCSKSE